MLNRVADLVQNFTVHPNPSDLFADRNFSSWAQEEWDTNRKGMWKIST